MIELFIGLIAKAAPIIQQAASGGISDEEARAALKTALATFTASLDALPAKLADNRANAEKILRGG